MIQTRHGMAEILAIEEVDGQVILVLELIE